MARFWLPQFVPHSLKRFSDLESAICRVDFRWILSTGVVDLLFQRVRLSVDWKYPVQRMPQLTQYLAWRFGSQIDGMRVRFPMTTSGAFNAPVLFLFLFILKFEFRRFCFSYPVVERVLPPGSWVLVYKYHTWCFLSFYANCSSKPLKCPPKRQFY